MQFFNICFCENKNFLKIIGPPPPPPQLKKNRGLAN
jgi:hypothetical protein